MTYILKPTASCEAALLWVNLPTKMSSPKGD